MALSLSMPLLCPSRAPCYAGDLLRTEAGDVAEHYHLALLVGQRLDRGGDLGERLPAQQTGLGQAVPARGQRRPHPLAVEAIGVHRRSVASLAAEERGEGEQP